MNIWYDMVEAQATTPGITFSLPRQNIIGLEAGLAGKI